MTKNEDNNFHFGDIFCPGFTNDKRLNIYSGRKQSIKAIVMNLHDMRTTVSSHRGENMTDVRTPLRDETV